MEIDLLSVVVPVYKQEKTITEDLCHIYETLKNTPYNFEIIVVIDGTTLDNSFENARKCAKKEIKVYGYPINKGKGQAVRFGMKKSKGNIVSFLDAGMDIHPSSIIMLLEHMKWYDADIIVASKLHPASKVKNYPLWRTKGYYFLTKLLFHMKIRDTQTGLKAFKREVLESVLDKMVIKTFAFDIELLAVSNRLGFQNVFDCPVEISFIPTNTNFSTRKVLKPIINMTLDTFAIWYRMNILHYYDAGKYRKKIYDKELDMWVNTGDMTDWRQSVINTVNSIVVWLTTWKKHG